MPSAKPPTKLYTLPAGFNPPRLIIPTQQTAIVQGEKGKASIRHDVALPVPEPHQVLVKTVAVSINPCDWKMPTKFPSPGSRIGSDFVGKVIAIGPECKAGVKLGDRVCGGIHGSNPIDPVSGAFAQYVAGHDDFLLKLPNHISWEDGAVLGGSVFATLRLALYESLGLVGMPGKPVEERPSPPVLVYGGSTSTGTMAIQILKLSGYKVITTCSPSNFELVRSFGAAEVFDYHSATCAADIKAYTGGKLRHVLDIITDITSQQICYDSFGRLGGRLCCLEMPLEALHTRKSVKKEMIVGLAATGKEIALGEGYERKENPEIRKFAMNWFVLIQKFLDSGQIKPHPPRVLKGGFEAILEGLSILKNKGTSGVKLACFVDPELEESFTSRSGVSLR